ncbi:MAG: glycosyltransferase family 2 protein [Flavitalea sp.]
MKISGFTIIKNAVLNDYPVLESIRSILPVVDEMIVSVGDSTDATEELIGSINSPKIKIVHSVWDKSISTGGSVLAVETNKAMQHVAKDSDWLFYIQADEVIHEKYHSIIRQTAERFKQDKRVDGLVFNYLHFFGTYNYIGDSRRWYHKEVRIIKNDPTITAYRDAQGFRRNNKKIDVKQVDAYVYHYGWVKSPKQMNEKQRIALENFWQDQTAVKEKVQASEIFDYEEYDSLALFKDSHPEVMKERINAMNWKIELDLKRKKFSLKDRFLYWFEKKTGIRPFDFRNYRIIR